MSFRKLFTFFVTLLLSVAIYGQKEGNIWYFGEYAGMDFNGGPPVALTNGALDTREGCATISDANGNLLFYTDGIYVWNRNHILMPNGSGLLGDPSSTQSGIILPQPGNNNLYYIFTVDNNANSNGLQYSIVNMNLAGGLGDVTTKNQFLFSPSTEKVTAVSHSNGTDIWVIAHGFNNNTFYSYLVTSAGLNVTAVTTNIGSSHSGGTIGGYNAALGYMKASPDGTRLAVAIQYNDHFDILDFNATTGVPSNPITSGFIDRVYGIEFSPDGSKLYVTERFFGGIYQYNLNAGSHTAIWASKTLIGSSANQSAGALQLAPDEKIYLARMDATYLGVINNPNALGLACNYVDNGFHLAGRLGQEGLPTFIQSFFYPTSFTASSFCFGDTTFFTLADTTAVTMTAWDFGDPASGALNTSTQIDPWHIFTGPGNYVVNLIYNKNGVMDTASDTITIFPLPQPIIGSDTAICDGEQITFDAGNFSAYLWMDGSTGQQITTNVGQTVWVEVSDDNNCINRDSLILSLTLLPQPVLNDAGICQGQMHTFLPGNFSSYLWSDGSSDPGLVTGSAGQYSVTVTDNNGCTNSDTANLQIFSNPSFNLGQDTFICEGSSIQLDPGLQLDEYYWSTGSNASSINISQGGIYWLTAIDTNGCSSSDTINIELYLLPVIDLGADFLLCSPPEYLNAGPGFNSYIWQDGTNAQIYTVNSPGIYHVSISNICGSASDTIQALECGRLYVPNCFTPNEDNMNDIFKPSGLNISAFDMYILNRWGEIIFHTSNFEEGWDGTYLDEKCAEGVYTYYIVYGRIGEGRIRYTKRGKVTLVY